MSASESYSLSIDGFDPEAVLGASAPGLPGFPCSVSSIVIASSELSPSLKYSASGTGREFTDICPLRCPILLRNSVFQAGDVFAVQSVSDDAFHGSSLSALLVSRNVAGLGKKCLEACDFLEIVAFERDSHLYEISAEAFFSCHGFRSIAIPRFVGLLAPCCFCYCRSIRSVMFEPPSRLATIDAFAFFACRSLDCLYIPASMTAIDGRAFEFSGIRSIEIEAGSVSFRVINGFLVDFGIRSLVLVIGSPESIVIPSSIETLGGHCCARKVGLRTVAFESNSLLRSIKRSAFAQCESLESICIPSSVEVLHEFCFEYCRALRRVTFGGDSKLRVIEMYAFYSCYSLESVSVPASVEFIGRQDCCSVSLPLPQSHSG
jgi:hypothetical protein